MVLGGWYHKATFALYRLCYDTRYLVGLKLVLKRGSKQIRAFNSAGRIGRIERAAITVGVGNAVNVGREWTEVLLVGEILEVSPWSDWCDRGKDWQRQRFPDGLWHAGQP